MPFPPSRSHESQNKSRCMVKRPPSRRLRSHSSEKMGEEVAHSHPSTPQSRVQMGRAGQGWGPPLGQWPQLSPHPPIRKSSCRCALDCTAPLQSLLAVFPACFSLPFTHHRCALTGSLLTWPPAAHCLCFPRPLGGTAEPGQCLLTPAGQEAPKDFHQGQCPLDSEEARLPGPKQNWQA